MALSVHPRVTWASFALDARSALSFLEHPTYNSLKDPDAYVFGNSKGKPQKNLERIWRKALAESGAKDFRFHDLRHTYASRLAMKGTDLLVLRDLLGHTDIKMTLRYAHLAPTKMLEAVKMLDLDFQNTCNTDEGHSEANS